MTFSTDVYGAHLNATGTAYAATTRVKGYQVAPGAAGSIVFRDGGASGTVRLELDTTVNTAIISTLIPGNGIRFFTDVHVTLPASTAITVFYG
jgi:hypothetical protein